MVDVPVDGLPDRTRLNLRKALRALTVLLLLGLSMAAVREMRVKCDDVYLTDDAGRRLLSDDGRFLVTGQKQCSVVMGDIRVPWPPGAQAIHVAR